jgi:predicted ester cyclase
VNDVFASCSGMPKKSTLDQRMRPDRAGAFAVTPGDLKTRARRIAEELFTQGDLPVADQLFAPDCRHHAPRALAPGADGAKTLISALRRAFPDLYAIVDVELAEGTWAAQRLTLTGTHRAPLFGVPACGRRIAWDLIEILRTCSNGMFDEHWCIWDERDLFDQIGTTPHEEGLIS